MNNAVMVGVGQALPKKVVTNQMLEKVVDTTDEWIRSRTGIISRHIATTETTTSLAIEAGRRALEDANIMASEIDLILVATMTPDDYMPSTACKLQVALGATKAAAMDLSAACSGFIYGLAVANSFIRSHQAHKVLVVGAEVLSKTIDWTDRSTCVIFGDGAGAVVVESSKEEGLIAVEIGAKGDDQDILRTPALATNNYYHQEDQAPRWMMMDGQSVFRFSTKIFGSSIKNVLAMTDYDIEDIDVFLPHQANVRIIDYAASRLKVDPARFYINLDRRGNTSAASIPIALADMKKEGRLIPGQLLCCTGFGGGLTWGSALLRITNNKK